VIPFCLHAERTLKFKFTDEVTIPHNIVLEIKEGIKHVKTQNDIYFWRGLINYYQKNYKDAEKLFDNILFDPNAGKQIKASALLWKSFIERDTGRDKDFIIHIDEFIKLNKDHPNYIKALRAKIKYYLKNIINFDEIIEYYHQSIKKFPENRDEINHLVGFNKGYNLFGVYESLSAMQEIPIDNKYYDWAQLYSGILYSYELNRFDHALSYFDKIRKGSDEYNKALILRAYIFTFHKALYFSALDTIDKIGENSDYYCEALFLKGIIKSYLLPDRENALKCFEEIVSRNNKKKDFLYYQSCLRAGKLYSEMEDYKKSSYYFGIAVSSGDPYYKEAAYLASKKKEKNIPKKLFAEALEFFHQREFEKSAAIYEKIISKYKDTVQADTSYFRLCDIYTMEFGDYFKAIKLLKEYIKTDHRHPDLAIYTLGNIYRDFLLNYREALKYYSEVMDMYDTSIWIDEAALSSADILIQIFKDYQAAQKVYEKALRLLPDSIIKARIKYSLGLLLEEKIKDIEAARKIYKNIITFDVKSDYFPDAYRHFIELDQRNEINDDKEQISGVRKGKYKILMKLASRYEELGENENAVKYYRDAYFLTDYKKHPEVYEKIVNIYEKADKYKELIKFLRQIIVKEDHSKDKDGKASELRWKIYSIYRDDLKDLGNSKTILKEIFNKYGRSQKYNANEILMSIATKKKLTVWPDIKGYSPDTGEIVFFKSQIFGYKDEKLEDISSHFRDSGFSEIIKEEINKRKEIEKLKNKSVGNPGEYLKISKFYEERKKLVKASEFLQKYADRLDDKNRNEWLYKSAKLLVKASEHNKAIAIMRKILSSNPDKALFNKVYADYLKQCYEAKEDFSSFTNSLIAENKERVADILMLQLKFLEKYDDQKDKMIPLIKKLLTMDEKDKPMLIKKLIDINVQAEQYRDAIENIDEYLALDIDRKDEFTVLIHKARIMEMFFSDYERADKIYKKALSLGIGDTKEIENIKKRIEILSEGKKLDDYLNYVEANLSSPDIPDVYLKIARIYEDYFSDFDSAEKYYNLLISGYPGKKETIEAEKRLSVMKVKKLIKSYREYLISNPDIQYAGEIEYRIARMYLDDLKDYTSGVNALKRLKEKSFSESKLFDKCRYSIVEAAYDFNENDEFIHEYSILKDDQTFSMPKKLKELKKKFDSRIKMRQYIKDGKYKSAMELAVSPLLDYQSFFDCAEDYVSDNSSEVFIISEIEKIKDIFPYDIVMKRLPGLLPKMSDSGKDSIYRIMSDINWERFPEKSIAFCLERNDISDDAKEISENIIKMLESDRIIHNYKDIFKLSGRIETYIPGKGDQIAALAFYKSGNIERALEILKRAIIINDTEKEKLKKTIKSWDAELRVKKLKNKINTDNDSEKAMFYIKASEIWNKVDKKKSLEYIDDFIALEYRPTDPELIIPLLFKASDYAEEIGKYEKAISYLRTIVVRFNDFKMAMQAQKKIAMIAAKKIKNKAMLEDSKKRFKRYYPDYYNSSYWNKIAVVEKKEKPYREEKKFKPTNINKEDLKDYYDEIKSLRTEEMEFVGSLKGAEIKEKISDIYKKIGDYKNSVSELESIVKNYPKDSWPDGIQIKIAENARDYLKDYNKAEKYLKEYIDTHTDQKSSISAMQLLSNLYSDNIGDYGKAIDILQELNERFGLSQAGKESIYKEADIYDKKLNNYEKAIELYKKFINDNIDNELAGKAAFRIAKIYEEIYSDYNKAKTQYEYIINTFPQIELRDNAQDAINTLRDEGKIQ